MIGDGPNRNKRLGTLEKCHCHSSRVPKRDFRSFPPPIGLYYGAGGIGMVMNGPGESFSVSVFHEFLQTTKIKDRNGGTVGGYCSLKILSTYCLV